MLAPMSTFNHQARDAVSWSEAEAVDSITHDMLETALEVKAEWHSDGDGGWSVAQARWRWARPCKTALSCSA